MSDNPMLADMAHEDGTEVATEVTQERPAWLPEGVNSGEELAAKYAELSRKQGSGEQQQPDGSPVTDDAAIPANNDEAAAFVEKAGLNFESFATEFAQYGELSRISYDELAKAGISRDVVDGYIAGQTAIADGMRNEVFNAAGGADAYQDMVGWASVNLSPSEIRAYDSVMGTGNTAQMRLAVDGLKSRFEAANGVAPKLMGGYSGSGGQSQGDVFSSMKEVTTAMRDERYATDPAYRKAVADKLGRSNVG